MSTHGNLMLDAESLYKELLKGVRSMLTPTTRLVGITSGGLGSLLVCKKI